MSSVADESMEEAPNSVDTGLEPELENGTGNANASASTGETEAEASVVTEKEPEGDEPIPVPVAEENEKAPEVEAEVNNVKLSEAEAAVPEPEAAGEEGDEAEAEEEGEEVPGIRVVSLDTLRHTEPNETETDEDPVEDTPPARPTSKSATKGLPIAVKSRPLNGRHTEGGKTLTEKITTRKRTASLTTSPDGGPKAKLGRSTSNASSNNSRSSGGGGGGGELSIEDSTHDKYCWVCHKIGVQFRCKICPRSYHNKCMPDAPELKGNAEDGTQCVCPECVVVMRAENINYRSEAMKLLSMDQLMAMLKQICGRMKTTQGAEPFLKPVLPEDAEDYDEYVIYPMDIAKLEKNIKQRQYGSTEAFLSDAQWIVHNSIIFNSGSSPYTAAAKRLLKVAKQELSEIETCPECYTNAHHKNNWFVEACKRPHILVWAKLKGFPYWPAKAMKIKDDQADVRFFGQHDRAWVNVKDCYLYSLEQPNAAPKRGAPLNAAVEELNEHIEKLKAMFGEVTLADPKVVMGPSLSVEQIQRLLPKYKGNEPSKQRNSAQLSAKSTSPMKITISSLNTPSPKVVSNSANEPTPESEEQSESENNETEMDLDETAASEVKSEEEEEEDEKSEAEAEPEEAEKVEKEENAKEKPKEKSSDDKGEEEMDTDEVRVPTGILASALGLKRVTRRSTSSVTSGKDDSKKQSELVTRKSGRRVSGANSGTKEAPKSDVEPIEEAAEVKDDKLSDDSVSQDESGNESQPKYQKQSKAQNFMDQAQTKPGHRFNISKDISISAIGDDMTSTSSPLHGNEGLSRSSTKVSATGRPITLGMKPGTFKNSPTPVSLARPRLSNNSNMKLNALGAGVNKALTQSQTSMQMQIQQMTQGMSSTNPRLRPTVVPSGAISGQRYCLNKDGSVRPMLKANRTSQGGINNRGSNNGRSPLQPSLVRGSTPNKDGNTGQGPISVTSSIQSGQSNSGGAITLPGGTITVTPLAPISLTSGSAGSTIPTFTGSSVTATGVNGISTISTGNKTNAGTLARRTGNNITLPQSVATHMNQCAKGVSEILKTTVEQIAFDILENGTTTGKVDAAVAQQEKEAIILKHSKELSDLRHNHDIAMRELRLSMEGEKRRAVVEMKRQCEAEKQKVLEEVKKKQWCARCAREAQFYCCWNTSYCGYHCQEDHWPSHMATCTQQK